MNRNFMIYDKIAIFFCLIALMMIYSVYYAVQITQTIPLAPHTTAANVNKKMKYCHFPQSNNGLVMEIVIYISPYAVEEDVVSTTVSLKNTYNAQLGLLNVHYINDGSSIFVESTVSDIVSHAEFHNVIYSENKNSLGPSITRNQIFDSITKDKFVDLIFYIRAGTILLPGWLPPLIYTILQTNSTIVAPVEWSSKPVIDEFYGFDATMLSTKRELRDTQMYPMLHYPSNVDINEYTIFPSPNLEGSVFGFHAKYYKQFLHNQDDHIISYQDDIANIDLSFRSWLCGQSPVNILHWGITYVPCSHVSIHDVKPSLSRMDPEDALKDAVSAIYVATHWMGNLVVCICIFTSISVPYYIYQ